MAWAAPSGGCGKQREPGAGAGGERASVRTGSGRRGRASHGRGQRADPAEPPAAQRRRALPDRRQRGHGQRQGTAGPRVALSPPPFRSPPGSRPRGGACGRRPRAVSVAAATAWPARLRSWQRSSAETSLRRLRAPLRGTGGWGLGPPQVPEVPRLPIAGLARSPGGSDSWPGSCGGGAEKTDAYCFASPTWGRGL